MSGVVTVRSDQCMLGLRTWSAEGEQVRAKKPTRFMTNSECIAKNLECRCDKLHDHQPLTQGRAKKAAEYPEEMCEAIVKGIREQIDKDHESVSEIVNMIIESTTDQGKEFEQLWIPEKGGYYDDLMKN